MRLLCLFGDIPASQCLVICRNITLYSGALIATINVRLLSRPQMCAPEHINIQLSAGRVLRRIGGGLRAPGGRCSLLRKESPEKP